ncbi:hypothetical protein [Aliidiomarina quisquiliarum]|uniref:hypothetical protein n=1 Tax=Aliidiomarina quisquiliarum TaxID=2938947 RepID=UPI00208F128A|nr:hypothetical protein [Aliidiomarina quisquiliarum]MCO4321228.1 hypothetical protein [Aliidiomarina quisquiliarum]
MRNYWLLILLLVITPAEASRALGVDWFSIVTDENEQLYLEVSHVLLGGGSKEAYFELKGCGQEPQWFQFDDKGNLGHSRFPLKACDFDGSIYLGLYFEEGGRKELFKIYRENSFRPPPHSDMRLHFTCRKELLYFGVSIPLSMQGESLLISYSKNDAAVEIGNIKVLSGNEFRIMTEGDFDCAQISGGYLNDTFFPKFEIPGA